MILSTACLSMLFLDLILVMLDPHAIYFKITTNIQFCKEFIPEHLAIIFAHILCKIRYKPGLEEPEC